jgi:hypothetical protein
MPNNGQYNPMTESISNIAFNIIPQTHECELTFKALAPMGVDDFFLSFVQDKEWDFSNNRYAYSMLCDEEYKYSYPLNEKYGMTFVSRVRESVPNARKFGFYIYEYDTRRPVISIKGAAESTDKNALVNCKMWLQNTQLCETEKIASDLLESKSLVSKAYGTMMQGLSHYCKNTIGKNMTNAA